MKQELHTLAVEAVKVSPAGAGWLAWTITAEAVYEWLGLAYLVLLFAYLLRKWWREEAEFVDKAKTKLRSLRRKRRQ